MNKTALKNFATNARKELMKKVEAKALKIGITEERIKKAQFESSDAIYIDGKQLSITEKKQRDKLIQRINEIGFKRVVEEVAYTWFNRFIALRFMEVNNYLPTKVRVLSSSNPDNPEPDIIKEALTVDLDIDKELVYDLKVNNKTEELFKYLVIKQCNSLNKYLPFMFETIEDYKEILFPEGLLAKDSFLRDMIDTEKIPESDWEKVEIIGWLYQYYIAEEKDRVIKAKKKYKTEEIPFATQLFTPNWIVRYMVQNTLGRYWVESHPEHRDLIKNWEFYLENPNPEPDLEERLAPFINKDLKVEDIKCFDPAMGSGHILVYMFDVLYEIYSRCGYMEREIPRLIIENNLYGLDIDDRAYQLACFSVVMKAVQYNNRFFRSIEKEGLKLNLSSIQETNLFSDDDIAVLAGERIGSKFELIKDFFNQFRNAKTFGSLIRIGAYDEEFLIERYESILNNPAADIFIELSRKKIIDLLPVLIKQAEIMKRDYDITITNPPYMGGRYMPNELSDFISYNYPEYKGDLFSAFINYVCHKTKKQGHIGLVTPYVWMFIKNYLELRKELVTNKSISSLIELEYNSFEGATVPVCTFTFRNYSSNISGEYIKLKEFKGIELQPIKVREAVVSPFVRYRYTAITKDFKKVTGNRIAYWFNQKSLQMFQHEKLERYIDVTGSQNITSNNEKYLRFHWEVEKEKINNKWPFYNKGGEYRKWYGNNEWVVDWSQEAREFYSNNPTANLLNEKYWFRDGLSYNGISNRGFSVRRVGKNIYDKGGPTIHPEKNWEYILGLLNSKVVNEIMNLYNPTLNYQVQDVKDIPIVFAENDIILRVESLTKENVEISKQDWDSYEYSFDFKKHPLLNNNIFDKYISNSVRNLIEFSKQQFNKLKHHEEQLNQIFIELYGLQDELSNEVDEKDVTISIFEEVVAVKTFISYAVGCMFGRYSLDVEGIVFAGGQFDPEKYQTFSADNDNIIPILQGSYFEDDIVSRFIDFMKVTFGEETLSENMEYIAETLGKKNGETSKETLRRYFLSDFFKDHKQNYRSRPIYWLFTSGKQKAFNCLIYMHRYDKTTLSRIRTDYLHELQNRLESEKKSLLSIIEGEGTAKEISNAKKELKALDLKIEELKVYDELLHHMADMQIEIDLDDGVAVNYAKFNGLLAKLE